MTLADIHRKMFAAGAKRVGGKIDFEFVQTFYDVLVTGQELGYVSVISQYLEQDKVQTLVTNFVDHSVLLILASDPEKTIQAMSFDDNEKAIRHATNQVAWAGGNPKAFVDRLNEDTLNSIIGTENPQ
jgi:hypothetical protein